MKKIVISLSVFAVFFAKAQQPELIGNTWYLEKTVISGTEYFPPTSAPEIQIQAIFLNDSYLTQVCDFFYGDVSLYTPTEIIIQTWGIGLQECPPWQDDYNDFQDNIYYSVLSNNYGGSLPYTLDYLIENVDNYKRLTLTNPDGDTAIYNNIVLSATDLGKTDEISLFPNPVTAVLNIETSLKIERINVYDASGKVVKTAQNVGKTIDISRLQNGVYHLEIFTDKGKVFRKIVVGG
ncbi:MAG: T9SS type A sorting domain-containing protein [Flavobacteriaceae bacterium]|jgi:hypothetical protein|nr:T9SS type A sorting domain-containing protein [Flavobacteriaceae bacterium]